MWSVLRKRSLGKKDLDGIDGIMRYVIKGDIYTRKQTMILSFRRSR